MLSEYPPICFFFFPKHPRIMINICLSSRHHTSFSSFLSFHNEDIFVKHFGKIWRKKEVRSKAVDVRKRKTCRCYPYHLFQGQWEKEHVLFFFFFHVTSWQPYILLPTNTLWMTKLISSYSQFGEISYALTILYGVRLFCTSI